MWLVVLYFLALPRRFVRTLFLQSHSFFTGWVLSHCVLVCELVLPMQFISHSAWLDLLKRFFFSPINLRGIFILCCICLAGSLSCESGFGSLDLFAVLPSVESSRRVLPPKRRFFLCMFHLCRIVCTGFYLTSCLVLLDCT